MRRIRTQAATLAAGGPPDDYKSRLLKYIPAEIVTLYVGTTGIVPEIPDKTKYLWALFVICLILTPIYFTFVTRDNTGKPLWLQVGLGTIAFPVWAYALGGPFAATPSYQHFVASILLMLVTTVFGWIKPK